MIHRTATDLVGTEREASGPGWKSRRFLLAVDGLGFSMHETSVEAGTELQLEYRAHSESVYCVEGKASLTDIASDRLLLIEPGTCYSVGIGEKHILRVEEDAKFLCVFEPALVGQEEAD